MRSQRISVKAVLVSLLIVAIGINFVACESTGDNASTYEKETFVLETDTVETADVATEIAAEPDSGPEVEVTTPKEVYEPPTVECYTHEECSHLKVPGSPPYCLKARCTANLKCELVADSDYCNAQDGDLCHLSMCNPEESSDPSGCVLLSEKTQLNCDDNMACTVDACDPTEGCRHESDDTLCNDGDPCTTDFCNTVEGCTHNPVNVDDGNPSTIDGCTTEGGVYHIVQNDTQKECELAEQCGPTGSACSIFYCQQGMCVEYNIGAELCNDNSPCTVDSCDSVLGCVNAVLPCDDGNLCTIDSCGSNGTCQNLPLNCNDGNPCTDDVCSSGIGCQSAQVNCDDGDACTIDSCMGFGSCVNIANTCDDADPSTIDTCNSQAGCSNTPDPNYCMIDSDCGDVVDKCAPWMCDNHACVQKEIFCDDGIACTEDYCENGNCQVWEDHNSCDEGLYCNGWYDYEPGISVSGCIDQCDTELDCDDGNDCTNDWCDGYYLNEGSKCVHEAQYTDYNSCSGGTCWAGECVECLNNGHCDDSDPCTEDLCDSLPITVGSGAGAGGGGGPVPSKEQAAGKCSHNPLSIEYAECDGNTCTQDSCDEGVCISSGECTDSSSECQVGTCVSDSWADYCSYESLDAGSSCTTVEGQDGSCSPWGECFPECSSHADCDDDKPCTIDSCDVLTGTCVHDKDYQAWDCIQCTHDYECINASVCVGGTWHWRKNATGICLNGSCELEEEPIACPKCDQHTWTDSGVAKVGLCQEQLLCPGGGPCELEDIDFTQDCPTCQDGFGQTFSVCIEGGECEQYASSHCGFNGTWIDGDCRDCFEDSDCNDQNPCTGEGTCSSWGYCQGMGESPDDWTQCDDVPMCGGFDDPPCEWGHCMANRCVTPKACDTNFECPGNDRPYCVEGYCQECLPAYDADGSSVNHVGCWGSKPLCQESVQTDPVSADNLSIYSCVSE